MNPLQCMRGTGYLRVLHIDAGMLCLPVHSLCLYWLHPGMMKTLRSGILHLFLSLMFSLSHTHTQITEEADIHCKYAIASHTSSAGSAAGGSVCWAEGTPASSPRILRTTTAEAGRVCLLWEDLRVHQCLAKLLKKEASPLEVSPLPVWIQRHSDDRSVVCWDTGQRRVPLLQPVTSMSVLPTRPNVAF